jgi:acetyl esterase/lipase
MLHRILFLMFVISSIATTGQTVIEFPLYSKEVPSAINSSLTEQTIMVKGTRRILNVIKPTLTLYKPEKANGTAVIICPGGGYARLSIDNEGVAVAQALNKIGVTAFVLKYRLPNDTIMIDKTVGPLQDLQQALRIVRQQTAKFSINENRIGVMGFSAGGHLAASALAHYNFKADNTFDDTTSLRPAFGILIYPVISFNKEIMHKGSRDHLLGINPAEKEEQFFSNELNVTQSTPPVFLVHAGDDATVPVENSIRFYQACNKNKVPAEMHIYAHGGHGFGLNNTTTDDKWMDRLGIWLTGLYK